MCHAVYKLYHKWGTFPATLGIIMHEQSDETILFVLTKNKDVPYFVKHYDVDHQKLSLHVMDEQTLHRLLESGSHKDLYRWIIEGEIVFDRHRYTTHLKKHVLAFPKQERSQKIGALYARFVYRLFKAKQLCVTKDFLDAYNHIVHALHYLARLTVIEQGIHPETTVWKQVKLINPETYKLYDELIHSHETIEKRIELLLIACDFYILSKLSVGSAHLLSIMENEQEHWTYYELISHPELKPYSFYLESLLELLSQKEYIKVLKVKANQGEWVLRYYSA